MKIRRSQLKQIIAEELAKALSEGYGRPNLPGSVYDPQGEPEIASPFRDKPKKSYGSGLSDVDRKAWEKRQAERDPDREYINMVKGIMRGMPGARVTASPNNERQNRLLAQAEEEFAMEQQQ